MLKLDRIVARLRAPHPEDELGASLILVVALMAMGFIISSLIAAACLFAIQQVSQGRANVAAFAAAEAGRDAVVATLAADPDNCVTTDPHFSGTDPGYDVTIYATDSTTQPTGSTGLTASCPSSTSTFVVLKSEGAAPGGGTTTVESVYVWESYRQRIAGGGLGFMDSAYTAYAVDYSGDIVVRHGDFTCGAGTNVDGSVYVLDGKLILPVFLALFGNSCDISGDVVTSDGIEVRNPLIGTNSLDIGGNVLVGGKLPNPELPAGPSNVPEMGALTINDDLDVDGDIEVHGTIAVTGRLTTDGSGRLGDDGLPVPKPDSTLPTGAIIATGAISVGGTLETTSGAISTNATISGAGTVRARTSVAAVGAISTSGLVQATTGAVASGSTITTTSSGDVSGASVTAVGGITVSSSGTVVATGGNVVTGGAVAAGTVTATGDVRAVGSIATTTANGRVQAGGSILSRTGSIQGTVSTANLQAGAAISAGTTITATGAINAATVTSVGTLTSSGNCTISGNVTAGGVVTFSQRGTDGGSLACRITGFLKTAATSVSALPLHATSGSSNRSQLYVTGVVESKSTWNTSTPSPGGRFRKVPGNAATAGTQNVGSITAPAAPAVTAPTAPAAVAVVAADYPELYLRTRWVDLGNHTTWNGFTDFYAVPSTSCGSARSQVQGLITTAGAPIVIDVTACTGTVSLTSWGSVVLRRDAVILLNNASLQFVRFTQSGATSTSPRQLFIIQVDNDLTMAPPASDPTGEPEPQPHCGGRNDINVFGTGWLGLADWDPLVRVMLYSPCGTGTSGLSDWRGHLYVANDGAHTDVISSVHCERMMVQGTLDLPCSVNDYGEWSGFQTVSGKRVGDRVYQTEP